MPASVWVSDTGSESLISTSHGSAVLSACLKAATNKSKSANRHATKAPLHQQLPAQTRLRILTAPHYSPITNLTHNMHHCTAPRRNGAFLRNPQSSSANCRRLTEFRISATPSDIRINNGDNSCSRAAPELHPKS